MVVGVIHLRAMPGDPAYIGGGFDAVIDAALADFDAYVEGGADAVMVENFGSAPFRKGDATSRIPAHQVALTARVVTECKRRNSELEIGVNCLRNDAHSALGIAAACDASMIRVNVHSGAYVTDQGLIEGEAYETLRYRQSLGCDVAIWADVLVKHATPLAPLDPVDATHDCVRRGMADAVIVTGAATGASVDTSLLEVVSSASDGKPVLLGSGVSPEGLARYGAHADGVIVGTWVKEEGILSRPVDAARVRQLVDAASAHLRSKR